MRSSCASLNFNPDKKFLFRLYFLLLIVHKAWITYIFFAVCLCSVRCWSSFWNVYSFPLRRSHSSFYIHILRCIHCLAGTKFKWFDCSLLPEWINEKMKRQKILLKHEHKLLKIQRETLIYSHNKYKPTNCTFSALRDNFLWFNVQQKMEQMEMKSPYFVHNIKIHPYLADWWYQISESRMFKQKNVFPTVSLLM